MAIRSGDRNRVTLKQNAVSSRIKEIAPHADMVVGMLDETKLDLLLVALGIGSVEIDSENVKD